MTMTTIEQDDITLPNLAIELRVSLDKLRRAVRTDPTLAQLCRRVGAIRLVRIADIDKVRTILGA